ncbi:MAG: glycosyltransferase [Flavobacteriaceae bacterium TMED238]|nr:MAG: glycosyltransferase [Flavobacteriaceae bacterium TMED238]|tara:strand:- start:103 stop:1233 length:1131 start_codon:yes stop_codon:yes gene_type:complete
MKNLLFYGTTPYAITLNSSDLNKFNELSKIFNTFVYSSNKNAQYIDHKVVKIFYIKKFNNFLINYLYFYFFNIFSFYKFVTKENIDIVSAKDPVAALIPTLLLKFRLADFKLVIEHHGDFLNLLLNQRKIYFKKFTKLLSKLISNFTYKNCDFIRGVHTEQTHVLEKKFNKMSLVFPAWVDFKTFYPKNYNAESNKVLFVGNIIPRKGVLFLIKSFEIFQKKNNVLYQLTIIGDTPNLEYFQECQNFITDNNIKNVKFYGSMNPDEIAEIMNNSALLVMASNFEGLPRVLIESGLCKLPSLATNIEGIATPFNSEGGTMVYEKNNSDEFVKNLELFFKNGQLQSELASKANQLSNSLSGSGVFGNNWKNIQDRLYE